MASPSLEYSHTGLAAAKIFLPGVAYAGLLLGLNLGVPGGGVSSIVSSFKPFFPSVYQKDEFDHRCKFHSQVLMLFSSFFSIGAIFALPRASRFTKRYGWMNTIFTGGIICLIGGVLSAAAELHISMLILGRILSAIGLGFVNQSVSIYCTSEMVPYHYRGRMILLYHFGITFGICAANMANMVFENIPGGKGWPLSLGLIPAGHSFFFLLFCSIFLKSLANRRRVDEAKTEPRCVRGVVDDEFWDVLFASKVSNEVGVSQWRKLLRRQYRPQLVMSILIPLFQQFTGIHAIMLYAPVLFTSLGFGSISSFKLGALISFVSVVATKISHSSSNRWGRRQLLLAGGCIMFVFQVAVRYLIGRQLGITEVGYSGEVNNLPHEFAIGFVSCICILVAAFGFTWGPLGWLIPIEIFPPEISSAALSVSAAVNMISTVFVAKFFLAMLCTMKLFLFELFALSALVMTFFIAFFLPETKNIPTGDMSQIWRKHSFWRWYFQKVNTRAAGLLEPLLYP